MPTNTISSDYRVRELCVKEKLKEDDLPAGTTEIILLLYLVSSLQQLSPLAGNIVPLH